MKRSALWPMLAGFFVMGFGDIIGTVMNQVKAECAAHADEISWLMPIFAYVWFLVISIPTGVMSGRIGRRNAVLVSLAVTVAAMVVPLFANAERWYLYVVAFALVGIGNTIIQAALPALMSNVVEPSQLASRISLGQFVKAICAALTPVFVYLTATALGNWKLLFPLYGLITVACALWLFFADIPDERACKAQDAAQPSFLGSLRLLGDGYVLAMVGGIFFAVAADVGFNVAIPDFLKGIYKMDVDKAGMGPTVYFIAKTLGAFLGALVFAKVSPARCFPWSVALALAGTAGIFFAPTWIVFLVCVFVASLGLANTFGMCMGLAINRRPEKTNEVSALVVMAIAGGGVVTPALGLVQGAAGVFGCVWVLLACLAYLFALGLMSSLRKRV